MAQMEQEAVSELSALCCEVVSPSTSTSIPADRALQENDNSVHSCGSLSTGSVTSDEPLRQFPPSCRRLVHSLPGNSRCIDCGTLNPQWASITYGILLCTPCAGRHRSFGVHVSKVRSIVMDNWAYSQIVAMLEGGNEQLQKFFERHCLMEDQEDGTSATKTTTSSSVQNATATKKGELTTTATATAKSQSTSTSTNAISPTSHNYGKNSSKLIDKRYHTNAAKFYRDQLALHVQKLKQDGCWKGREASRKKKRSSGRRSVSDSGSRRDGGGSSGDAVPTESMGKKPI